MNRQRLPAGGDRFVEPPLRGEDDAQVAVIFGGLRTDGGGASNQVHRGVVVTGAVGEHAEQVQSLRVVGFRRQYVPQQRFGLAILAAREMLERQLHLLLCRRRCLHAPILRHWPGASGHDRAPAMLSGHRLARNARMRTKPRATG